LPGVIVPGGVPLPARDAEDAGQVQSLGARFAHDLVSLDYAAEMGCRACGSSGGGCQFLGTAATSQVIAEALGLALPHSALAPFENAMLVHAAFGGSTNLLLHVPAIAAAAGLKPPSPTGYGSIVQRRGWLTHCQTDHVASLPRRCSWRAACPK
jgi:dihydroxyacid dehydratase/phosphogluconate dehydratase